MRLSFARALAARVDHEYISSSFFPLTTIDRFLQLEKLAEMLHEPRGKYGGNADAGAGDDVRSGVGGMKEEFTEAGGAALYSSEGGGGGGGKLAHFTDDDVGALFRPSPQPTAAGFTSSGPPEHQPFQFHSSCWPSSTTEQTCSSSQWWEFESLTE
jgi:homeobox-leucine zipper protein